MADETTSAAEPTTEQTQPQGSADGTDWKAEARKWEARCKADLDKLADYDDLKAKAARLDEIEEANKTDLERANDAASKAKAKADEWKSKYEALQAEQERMSSVAKFSAQYKVDAGTLSRMMGDVEENAKYLANLDLARPKYPAIVDDGATAHVGLTLEEIDKIANPAERIRATAKYYRENPDR